jgi:hypothetical protein
MTMRSDSKPKLVNIINFVRQMEPRAPERDLIEPVIRQIELSKAYSLPATFLLQYDAIIDSSYTNIFKICLNSSLFEVGGWLEIVQPLVEKTGLIWRGQQQWDWRAHIGFSIGYTPHERELLVDTFMNDFKDNFGFSPKSVGAWFIDAHTLGYLADRYGVVASCNCKDQIGTDGYTLWGGYWNQAYYPSRTNGYMPAQSQDAMIPVPVFRMLGSDPIYQYGEDLMKNGQGVISLEPISSPGGGDPLWCEWFFKTLADSECLTFGYTQAGQENSFGWDMMKDGYIDIIKRLAKLRDLKKVRVETLCDSGNWFRLKYPVTPPSSVVALDDWQKKGKGSVWYNSRYYRINIFWENGSVYIRDIHFFNELYPERYLHTPAQEVIRSNLPGNKNEVNANGHKCIYDTLPVMDGANWSSNTTKAGIFPIQLQSDDLLTEECLKIQKTPEVKEEDGTLSISCSMENGSIMNIICKESCFDVSMENTPPNYNWQLKFQWDFEKCSNITCAGTQCFAFIHENFSYHLMCKYAHTKQINENVITITPETSKIIFDFCHGYVE